jgi:hypothetical protein
VKPVLSILLHGDSGVGKSWLAGSAVQPVLVLDVEGRARYLPYPNKVEWEPQRDKPPEAGEWTHCVVNVTRFSTLQSVYQWLQSGQHCFRSVVLDSLMEAQKRFIDELVGMEQLQTQHWGDVLRHLESLVRSYRDLTLSTGNTIDCVVFTVGSKVSDAGKTVPLLQGALQNTLPYYLDAVGYLYVVHENGTPTRNLLVQPTPTIVAKDGTGRLGGPIIPNPNLTTLFNNLERNES